MMITDANLPRKSQYANENSNEEEISDYRAYVVNVLLKFWCYTLIHFKYISKQEGL